eukprot:scaffold666660_cov74-Prasinocladus_malaysianus.AAC.1
MLQIGIMNEGFADRQDRHLKDWWCRAFVVRASLMPLLVDSRLGGLSDFRLLVGRACLAWPLPQRSDV